MKAISNANYDSVEYKNYVLAKKKALQTSTSSSFVRPPAVENRAAQVVTAISAIALVKAQTQPVPQPSQPLLSQPQPQPPQAQPQPQPQQQQQPKTIRPNQQLQQQQPQQRSQQRPQRPSFSEQLAAIGAQADSVTQGMRKDRDYLQPQAAGGGQGGVIATMPARCFTIGALSCRYPSPVTFFSSSCIYEFHHPFEASVVQMTIYYKDMRDVSVSGTRIRFRLPRAMALFLKDYDPANPTHQVTIELSSALNVDAFKAQILPRIKSQKG